MKIAPSTNPLKLNKASDELIAIGEKIEFYSFIQGRNSNIDEYIDKNCVNAIVVIKDGAIVYEKYSQWTWASDKLYSASMAKTLTSIMIGILLDRKLLSLSTKVSEIYPELEKSAFSSDTIEDLLRMSSSAKLKDCAEECSDGDNQILSPIASPNTNTLKYLSQKIEVGEKSFFYSGANTALLGLIIARVSGKDPAIFWKENVWSSIGAESDGYWMINNKKELGFQCCFMATAHDWLKIGIMLANYGEINNRQIISTDYVNAMASNNIKSPRTPNMGGYGLHVWIPRNTPRGDMKTLEMAGSHGQFLVIDPISKIVILHSGSARTANSPFKDWVPLRYAIQNALK
jgi:CubicO group peptidase (beta-lactamase class C family)